MSEWPETNENLILRVKDPRDEAAWMELIAVYRRSYTEWLADADCNMQMQMI